ncbi:NAD-dependent protein deacetylase sirtuin-2 [Gaertneriomyces sp. JEL0708]|nr:NAD-dependent protein deacetylase sirtuin-2 [Gaertneriomyces sp. JEL0708]
MPQTPSKDAPSDGGSPSNFWSMPSTRKAPTERKLPPSPLEQKKLDPSLNIITEPTIEQIARYVKEKDVKKVLVLTGAGISTSAGIPDFRSPGTGLYDNLKRYNLPFPEAIFTLNYFLRYPEPFYTLARELFPGTFRPTPCHYFIRLLQEKGMLLRNYTQNIDILERAAGVNENLLVEAHGSFAGAACVGRMKRNPEYIPQPPQPTVKENDSDSDTDDFDADAWTFQKGCGKTYSIPSIKSKIMSGEIPVCTECDGYIKPTITFFGEALPDRFHELLQQDFPQTDLVIVIGTSLQVAPFSRLIHFAPGKVPRLLINREVVGVQGVSGFDFVGDKGKYRRDALWLGNCDDGVRELVTILGWEDEFTALMEREKQRLDLETDMEEAKESAGEKVLAVVEAVGEVVGTQEEVTPGERADDIDEVAELLDNLTVKDSKI